jgi:hypothetical protein
MHKKPQPMLQRAGTTSAHQYSIFNLSTSAVKTAAKMSPRYWWHVQVPKTMPLFLTDSASQNQLPMMAVPTGPPEDWKKPNTKLRRVSGARARFGC